MAETATLTLTEFLLARIAEDEATAIAYRDGEHWGNPYGGDGDGSDLVYADRFNPARVLAECEAKRQLVDAYADALTLAKARNFVDSWENGEVAGLKAACELLAAVYADHPDYRKEWAL